VEEVIKLRVEDILLKEEDFFILQGYSSERPASSILRKVYRETFDIFCKIAELTALLQEISREDFFNGYQDERNIPVARAVSKAANLALFALTCGSKIDEEISYLFSSNDITKAYLLDSIASVYVEQAVLKLESIYKDYLIKSVKREGNTCVLSYSPGYCGWDIKSQRWIFDILHPHKIGISLMESYLMQPLKSVTGVLVSGDYRIHIFENNYEFCKTCKSRSCRDRIKQVLMKCKHIDKGKKEEN